MKRFSLLLVLVFLFQGVAMAQFTNHPRYAQINTLVQTVINSIHDQQAIYFQANGKYFQGILVPSTVEDGLTDVSVDWAVKPSDQTDSWKTFAPNTFKTNFKIPFQVAIDVYRSPLGWGWILRIEVWIDGLGPDVFGHDGNHWIFKHNEGPASPDIVDTWHISLDD